MDSVDGYTALLVTKHDSAQHDFFGQLKRFRLDHQHSGFGASYDQIHDAVFALGLSRVQDVFAIDISHTGRAHGAVERDTRNGQGGRGADHGGDVSVHLRIQRNGVYDHMHFVVKTFGEQRTDGTVNQTTGECFKFAGFGFALEETARYFAGSVGFLDVVNGQRKEILTRFGTFGSDDSSEYDGIVNSDQHRSAGLASNFTGFHGDRVLAPLESFAYFVE